MNECETYKDSLSFRLESAKYHLDTIYKINKTTNIEDSYIPISSEFTALMLALLSSLDILSQFINCNLSNKKNEKDVSFHQLYQKLDKINLQRVVKDKIKKLHECKEREYLSAFCNVSKHRRMIKVSDQWAFISPAQPIQYLVVDRFEYNGNEFKEADIIYIARETFNPIYSGIYDIGALFEKLS